MESKNRLMPDGCHGRLASYRSNLARLSAECPGDAQVNWDDWRWQLAHRVTSQCRGISSAAGRDPSLLLRYPCSITPYYLSLAEWQNERDPVRVQCCPDVRELESGPCETDPFGEHGSTPFPGLVHRFPDRVLIVATAECAVSCRHCTRKNTLAGLVQPSAPDRFQTMLEYIRAHAEIREVLVSGGDPLLLGDDRLDWLLGNLHAITHVEVIRIGTRVPVVLPMRVTEALVCLLERHRPLWVNTQFNHPVEVTPEAAEACARLLRAGIPVSNQSVLLKGVNDNVDTMRRLCNSLQRHMIRPYYVFQCDPIPGIAHLRTAPGVGQRMARELRASLGGLSMPLFVADIPGRKGKTPL